jgi:hypothetical protein
MRSAREAALRDLIECREQEFAAEMEKLSNGASELPDEMLTAMIEMEDLRGELQWLSGDPFNGNEERSDLNP